MREDKESNLKRISLGEMWAVDLIEAGLELNEATGIQSTILTRSMSQRLKFILATHDKIAIMSTKDGKIENTVDFDEEIDGKAPVKLFSFTTGFGIQNKNKLILKKLASSGKVDSTYQPCSTLTNLVDVVYDFTNPALLFGLTEVTNELILFSISMSKQECSVSAKMSLSETDDRSVFDSLEMFGSLLVARNTENASLHLFKSNPDD